MSSEDDTVQMVPSDTAEEVLETNNVGDIAGEVGDAGIAAEEERTDAESVPAVENTTDTQNTAVTSGTDGTAGTSAGQSNSGQSSGGLGNGGTPPDMQFPETPDHSSEEVTICDHTEVEVDVPDVEPKDCLDYVVTGKKVCTKCGSTTTFRAAGPHTWARWEDRDDGITVYKCTVCGETMNQESSGVMYDKDGNAL